jgi:hypothetical protein
MDNGAFAGFDATRFVAMLDRYRQERGCLFVVAPDVVGDAASTLKLWPFWSQAIRGYGFPVAFVAQDGLTARMTPWTELDALFIGGTTAFKLSREARMLAGYAKARGKWLHMGRVNSRRRVKYALQLGVDSIDGTGWCRWADIRLTLGTRWLREFAQQPELRL